MGCVPSKASSSGDKFGCLDDSIHVMVKRTQLDSISSSYRPHEPHPLLQKQLISYEANDDGTIAVDDEMSSDEETLLRENVDEMFE